MSYGNNINEDPYINRIIFSKYLVQRKIGKGSFGIVYQGIINNTHEKIAVKIEKRSSHSNGTLESEAYRLIYLKGEGIPKVHCYGNNQTHNILVEELLGKSLEEIFNRCGKKFSLKTVCVLGIEMINRIEHVHKKYHLHRDIKPDNFMVGREEHENDLYIIDFGLAKKYYSQSKHKHIKFCDGKSLIGTARYCGRNAHKGYEQGRRDDIESIGYVLIYFLKGSLPWQGIKFHKGEDQFRAIARKKCSTSFEELTKGQPEEFLRFFKHADELGFEEEPNYEYLRGLFQSMINKYCNDCFYDFDWKKKSSYFTHLSEEQLLNELNKSNDVSLMVNKNNNDVSLEVSGYEINSDNSAIEKEDNLFNSPIKKPNRRRSVRTLKVNNYGNILLRQESLNKIKVDQSNKKVRKSLGFVNIIYKKRMDAFGSPVRRSSVSKGISSKNSNILASNLNKFESPNKNTSRKLSKTSIVLSETKNRYNYNYGYILGDSDDMNMDDVETDHVENYRNGKLTNERRKSLLGELNEINEEEQPENNQENDNEENNKKITDFNYGHNNDYDMTKGKKCSDKIKSDSISGSNNDKETANREKNSYSELSKNNSKNNHPKEQSSQVRNKNKKRRIKSVDNKYDEHGVKCQCLIY